MSYLRKTSKMGPTSLQGSNIRSPMQYLFGGLTVVKLAIIIIITEIKQ